ncbi:MAG: hypothetical protein ICV63_00435 [Coleofasciculus sp. Co-bin14]|nr:hypothetical protein [Coleofasciculus sp. Co-bin14]
MEIEIQDSPIDSDPNASPLPHYFLGNLSKEKCLLNKHRDNKLDPIQGRDRKF